MAGGRPRASRIRLRRIGIPRARPYGDRCRRSSRFAGSSAHERPGLLRRLAPEQRPHGHDQDHGRLRGHTAAPRLSRGDRRRRSCRGGAGRSYRALRRSRGGHAVCPPRRQAGRRPQGLRRSRDFAAAPVRAGWRPTRSHATARCGLPASCPRRRACSSGQADPRRAPADGSGFGRQAVAYSAPRHRTTRERASVERERRGGTASSARPDRPSEGDRAQTRLARGGLWPPRAANLHLQAGTGCERHPCRDRSPTRRANGRSGRWSRCCSWVDGATAVGSRGRGAARVGGRGPPCRPRGDPKGDTYHGRK
jgi:hypothetical protein